MMSFEVLAVSSYAGISTVLVQLGKEALKFQCFKVHLIAALDALESVAIGELDRDSIADLPIHLLS